jgi:hypothetical protein
VKITTAVNYFDKDKLNELSFIRPKPEDILGKEHLQNYGRSILPQSMKLLEQMTKELEDNTAVGQKVTQPGPGFKVTQSEQVPYN